MFSDPGLCYGYAYAWLVVEHLTCAQRLIKNCVNVKGLLVLDVLFYLFVQELMLVHVLCFHVIAGRKTYKSIKISE